VHTSAGPKKREQIYRNRDGLASFRLVIAENSTGPIERGNTKRTSVTGSHRKAKLWYRIFEKTVREQRGMCSE